jgi:hypothetical protein
MNVICKSCGNRTTWANRKGCRLANARCGCGGTFVTAAKYKRMMRKHLLQLGFPTGPDKVEAAKRKIAELATNVLGPTNPADVDIILTSPACGVVRLGSSSKATD